MAKSPYKSLSWEAFSLWHGGMNTLEVSLYLTKSREKIVTEAMVHKFIARAQNEIYERGFSRAVKSGEVQPETTQETSNETV